MPTSTRPTALLAPIGRGDHTSPPGIAPQLMKKPCHCEVAPRPWRSVPPALRFLCLRRLPFFLRQKKGRKERRQDQGFGILFAAEVSTTSVSSYLADRDVQNLHLAFVWSLRRHPLAAHAGPRCPDAAGIHSASAVIRNISCHRFVGDDAHIVPPGKRGVWRGMWAPSYIVLRCRSRADRGVRSYKGNGFPHRCAHWFGMTG
mgnify:CR=1 FL=1